jgi:uncharacterized BrkB/YihY/UPF0761 family membrane protein
MRPRQMLSLLLRAYADWSSDGAARLGAALAYFTLFSVAPILIVVTGVAGLFIGQAAAKGQVVVTALLFNAGTIVLSMFLGTAAGKSVYGTAASVLALLLWVYYSAQVFFFGAEVTRIFANEYGARIVPHHRSLGGLWRRQSA